MICKQIVDKIILNEPEHICLHTVKWFQVLLSTQIILFRSFVCTQLNGFTYRK